MPGVVRGLAAYPERESFPEKTIEMIDGEKSE